MVAEERPYRITHADSNITAAATFGVVWLDLWKFRCPPNMSVILKKGDFFSAYLVDGADAEVTDPAALVKIEVRDPSERNRVRVFGPANYARVNEFQDKKLRATLELKSPVEVKPNAWIVIMTKDDVAIDTASMANCIFELFTSRVVS